MCVELKMNVSILSLRWLSDPVNILSASVSIKVVRQDMNLVLGDPPSLDGQRPYFRAF